MITKIVSQILIFESMPHICQNFTFFKILNRLAHTLYMKKHMNRGDRVKIIEYLTQNLILFKNKFQKIYNS